MSNQPISFYQKEVENLPRLWKKCVSKLENNTISLFMCFSSINWNDIITVYIWYVYNYIYEFITTFVCIEIIFFLIEFTHIQTEKTISFCLFFTSIMSIKNYNECKVKFMYYYLIIL